MTDLASLFMPPPAKPSQGVSYRQGVIVDWNPATAENQVNIGGVTMDNLPVLNTSEALLLQPGDVVAVLVVGDGGAKTLAILGRLTVPGTPDAASALKVLEQVPMTGASDAATFTTTSGSYVSTGLAITVNVSDSGRLMVTYSAEIGWVDSTTDAASGGFIAVALSGANSVAASDDIRSGFFEQVGGTTFTNAEAAAGRSHIFEGLASGSTTITLMARSAGSGKSIDFKRRHVNAMAL